MSDERIAGLDPGSTFWPPLARTREVAAPDSQAPEESPPSGGLFLLPQLIQSGARSGNDVTQRFGEEPT
jgi:hypothetical protein